MKQEKISIYPASAGQIYNRQKELLSESNLSNKNKEFVEKFANHLFSTGSGEKRVGKLIGQLRRIGLHLNKDFDVAAKVDIETLIAFYNRQEHLSNATKSDYRRIIKQFYLWLGDDDDRLDSDNKEERIRQKKFYKYIKNIKRGKEIREINPNIVITEEEIAIVLQKGCRTQKERAFIKMLHETGARIGEFLTIRISEVKISGQAAEVTVNGKTGERTIPFLKSISELTKWLEIHPYGTDKNSFLWVCDNTKERNKPLKYAGAVKLIRRCFERAKLSTKKCNPHWFKHSRASLNGTWMTEQVMDKYFGWEIGSNMPRIYCHMNKEQVTQAFLKGQGIKPVEQKDDQPVQCICGTINDKKTSRYCYKCGKPLSMKIVMQDKEKVNSEVNNTVKFMMEMTKKPELIKAFEEFQKSKNHS